MDRKDEFLLHLYDKLWENISSRENRFWTFLAVYGAAVGLLLGTNLPANLKPYAMVLVLALTVWAILIVNAADSWQRRNLLMIARVEQKFDGASDGILPRIYKLDRYRVEYLTRASILILSFIAITMYVRVMWPFIGETPIQSIGGLLAMVTIHVGFVAAVVYCVHQLEGSMRVLFDTRGSLLAERLETNPAASLHAAAAADAAVKTAHAARAAAVAVPDPVRADVLAAASDAEAAAFAVRDAIKIAPGQIHADSAVSVAEKAKAAAQQAVRAAAAATLGAAQSIQSAATNAGILASKAADAARATAGAGTASVQAAAAAEAAAYAGAASAENAVQATAAVAATACQVAAADAQAAADVAQLKAARAVHAQTDADEKAAARGNRPEPDPFHEDLPIRERDARKLLPWRLWGLAGMLVATVIFQIVCWITTPTATRPVYGMIWSLDLVCLLMFMFYA